jgi:pSer/pThr/pTyr-binding forkhead associated (FHA) protein
MKATTLILVLFAILPLAATAVALAIKKRRQAQAPPSQQQSIPGPASPYANPLLHDETLLGSEAGAAASAGRSGAARHVTVLAGAPKQTYTLHPGRPLMVGRRSSHTISFSNHRVSRDHARLVFINDAVQLTDLGSANGTFVSRDKRRLAPNAPELLAPGEVFWIGPDVKLSVDAARESDPMGKAS